MDSKNLLLANSLSSFFTDQFVFSENSTLFKKSNTFRFKPLYKIQLLKILVFNYKKYVKEPGYMIYFCLKFYYYYNLFEYFSGSKPAVKKVKFFSLLKLKKKKKFNFKLEFSVEKVIDYSFFYFFLTSQLSSNVLQRVFKFTGGTTILQANKNRIYLKLQNFHFFFSLLTDSPLQLQSTSFFLILWPLKNNSKEESLFILQNFLNTTPEEEEELEPKN